ncbi:MAG: cell division protein FtsH, partial [Rhodospirillaceae bacterium]|nr:cell division protein FtsH [Rhodospirillaceae bacterium]
EHIDQLHTLANGLLEFETLNAAEIDQLLKGEKIVRPDESEEAQAAREAGRPRRTSVPTSSRPEPEGGPGGGMEPEPQT